mgnify:CR=1 FL=1
MQSAVLISTPWKLIKIKVRQQSSLKMLDQIPLVSEIPLLSLKSSSG